MIRIKVNIGTADIFYLARQKQVIRLIACSSWSRLLQSPSIDHIHITQCPRTRGLECKWMVVEAPQIWMQVKRISGPCEAQKYRFYCLPASCVCDDFIFVCICVFILSHLSLIKARNELKVQSEHKFRPIFGIWTNTWTCIHLERATRPV